MTKYYPNAIAIDKKAYEDGRKSNSYPAPIRLFTTDSVETYHAAMRQFTIWNERYETFIEWIEKVVDDDCKSKSIVYFETYVDPFGNSNNRSPIELKQH